MDQIWPGAKGAEIAYEAIAPAYDDFTAHHNYDAWLKELLAHLEPQGLTGRRLLDVGCGTGKSFIPMLDWGWEVTACDVSPAMVELARGKVGERADLSVADMRALPHFGEFDLVWCLDDAINYLLSGEELEETLGSILPNLEPETGLFIFDTNTLQTYRTFFAEEVEVEMNGRRMLWHGRSSPDAAPGSIAEAVFEAEPLEGSDMAAIAPESHRQRHFSEAEIVAALESSGFECLQVYGMSTDGILRQPLEEVERHSKAAYIARAARD
ncbi:MAG: class I SAM-dependent methyltransferase [Solirubrobacterales bacterium]